MKERKDIQAQLLYFRCGCFSDEGRKKLQKLCNERSRKPGQDLKLEEEEKEEEEEEENEDEKDGKEKVEEEDEKENEQKEDR